MVGSCSSSGGLHMADHGLLAQQRRALIVAGVGLRGAVRVADLVEQFGVSDMTVRRDLDALARAGAVEKVYGGAVSVRGTSAEEPLYEAKAALELASKAAIADTAAALVEPGSVVAISAGTTAYAVATRLMDVPDLTVITNSLPVADLVRTAARRGVTPAPTLLLTGGTPTPSAALVGPTADLVIRSLHADLLILGAHGVSADAGLTTPNLAEAQTNRALVANARRVVVVADHTKWGVIGLSGFADLDEIDSYVTDDALPDDARAVLSDSVGELVTVTCPSSAVNPCTKPPSRPR